MPISEKTRKRWLEKLAFINDSVIAGRCKLTSYEESFIESVGTLLSKVKDLSHRQSKWLNRIYERCERASS